MWWKNVIFEQRIEKGGYRGIFFLFFFFLLQVASLLGGGWAGAAEEGSFTVSTHNRAPICQIISHCGRTKVFICPNFIHQRLNTSSLYCDGPWERQLADGPKSGEKVIVKRPLDWMRNWCDVGRIWRYYGCMTGILMLICHSAAPDWHKGEKERRFAPTSGGPTCK